MKFGNFLISIKQNKYCYIDYNFLKKQIFDADFTFEFENAVYCFDQEINQHIEHKICLEVYEVLVINYLSILKLLKKFEKKNFFHFMNS